MKRELFVSGKSAASAQCSSRRILNSVLFSPQVNPVGVRGILFLINEPSKLFASCDGSLGLELLAVELRCEFGSFVTALSHKMELFEHASFL